ncbi:MAG: VCBS repeat-containing protein, partial [Planctomycetales bacterium]|nr:VCBS repeat-containing protein [Planctomycetales bacterium]
GDGDMDVVTQSVSGVAWHENLGDGSYATQVVTTTSNGGSGLYVADIDRNGSLDLVSAALNNDRLSWYRNNGSESFSRRTLSMPVTGVTVGDLDQDGDQDVMTSSWFGVDDGILWYENLGAGTFTRHNLLPGVRTVEDLAVVDLDGDGDVDVVAARSQDDQLLWLENDGAQGFTSHVIDETVGLPSSYSVNAVYPVDLDNDGDIDLSTGSNYDDDVAWYENDGSQNFSPHIVSSVLLEVADVSAADLDGDGDSDLVAVSYNSIDWFENDGAGAFVHHAIGTGSRPDDVFPADMDGDGDLDLLVTFYDGGRVVWYENANPEIAVVSFNAATTEESGVPLQLALTRSGENLGPASASFRVAGTATWGVDYVIDGAAESNGVWRVEFGRGVATAAVVVTPLDDAAVEIDETVVIELLSSFEQDSFLVAEANRAVLQITSGEFGSDFGDAPSPYPTSLAENGASHPPQGPRLGSTRDYEDDGLHSADADADGTDEDGASFGTLRAGQIQTFWTVDVQNAPTGAYVDAWIDFNGDGSWNGSGERIYGGMLDEGVHELSFETPVDAMGATYARVRINSIRSLAPDGGAADGEVEDYRLEILPPQAASGIFNPAAPLINDAPYGDDVTAVDFDGDGDQDLLAATFYNVLLLENDGQQNYTHHVVAGGTASRQAVIAADIDSDGDLDVLSVASGVAGLSWYVNVAGTFVTHDLPGLATNAVAAQVADLDGDGDQDIAFSAVEMGWLENDGSQNFTRHVLVPGDANNFRSDTLAVGDIDGDGDVDLLAGRYATGGAVAWFTNNGAGEFTPNLVDAAWSQGGAIVDLDRDGDMDLVASMVGTGAGLAWFENDGSESFVRREMATGRVASKMAVADVEGDGDWDVVAIYSNEAYWLANDGAGEFTYRQLATYYETYAMVVADIDGDGDL